MLLIARLVLYVLLGFIGLLSAALAFGVGALLGAGVGAVSFLLLDILSSFVSLDSHEANKWASWCALAGAMLGGGCALLGLARVWISQAQASDDPIIRGLGDYLDDLGRAVKRPVPR